jgi:hypothetical protein
MEAHSPSKTAQPDRSRTALVKQWKIYRQTPDVNNNEVEVVGYFAADRGFLQ